MRSTAALQNRPEVLQLRLHHLMQAKRWRCASRQSETLPRRARLQRRFPPCRILSASAGQDRRSETSFLLTGPAALREGTDLLLQHGLLRSASRQSRKRAIIWKSVSNGRLLSRAREERSGSRIDSASDLSAIQERRSPGHRISKSGRFGKRPSVITLRDMTRTSDGLINVSRHFSKKILRSLASSAQRSRSGRMASRCSISTVDFAMRTVEKPWTADTLVLFWSATKGLGSACLLHVLQEHEIDLSSNASRNSGRNSRRAVKAKSRLRSCSPIKPACRARSRTVDVTRLRRGHSRARKTGAALAAGNRTRLPCTHFWISSSMS